jgi:hypothetical protein
MLVPYGPETALLGISPNELIIYVHAKNCTWAYRSFIHNFQNLNATKIFFSWLMGGTSSESTQGRGEDR